MIEQLPLEQLIVHRREPAQLAFASRAVQVVPESDDYRLEPAAEGLRVHAANETALEVPREILCEVFGDELNLMPVSIKFERHGELLYEPVMSVRTEVRADVQSQLRAALHSRGAEILEEDTRRMLVVTRALAALQGMLGFPQTLRALAGDNARLWVWLSHYAPAAGKAERGTQ